MLYRALLRFFAERVTLINRSYLIWPRIQGPDIRRISCN